MLPFKKSSILIGLAMLYHMWDRVLAEDRPINIQITEDAITEEECANSKKIPVLREEASNIGLIHSKRFLSPEIKIEHSIVVTKNDSKDNLYMHTLKNPIYTYTRDYRQDKVHPTLPYEGDLLKYKKEYFNTLLNMFPSMHGYVSMWSDRKDSFFSFINRADVEEHKYKILASLLLLAEGVDVPLEIDESESGTELVLKKADEGEHFRVSINALIDMKGEDAKHPYAHEEMRERGVVSVVNFFIQNRKHNIFTEEKDSSKPSHCKQLEKAKFVNSPAFLIQTYIRHCLESTEEIALFIQTVRDLLSEYMGQKKANSEDKQRKQDLAAQAKSMFSRYFISDEQRSNYSQGIDAASQPKALLYSDVIDHWINPFYLGEVADVAPAQVKMGSLVSFCSEGKIVCNPNKEDSSCSKNLEPAEGFTDYGETALLGLFCWAAYNTKEHMHTVHHIESASEELKSFFRKHKCMYGVVSKSMHDDWNKVVGGLTNPNIQYMRADRNQIVPGIINMLYVIKEITGVGDTKKLDELRGRLEWMEDEQKIEKVRMLHWKITDNANNTEEERKEMERQFRAVIDEKEQNKKKMLVKRLENLHTEDADGLELKIQKLEKVTKERKIMDLDSLLQSYIKQENALKAELASNIEEHLIEIIKKVAMGQNVSIDVNIGYKQTLNRSCSDVFISLRTYYKQNEETKNVHLPNPYYYEFDIYPEYIYKTIRVKWNARFMLYRAGNPSKRTVLPETQRSPSIIHRLNSYISGGVEDSKSEAEHKSCSGPDEQAQAQLFYGDRCRNTNTLLLDPLMHIPKYKIYIVWALLLHAKDRNLNSTHPFVRLADNLLESARFIDRNDKDAMFVLLSLISADKHYPHITINKHAYEKPHFFTSAVQKVLELANNAELASYKTYADIVADLMISLHRTCMRDRSYCYLEWLARNLNSPSERPSLMEILTLNGATMDYIAGVAQTIEEIERADSPDHYKESSNKFLLWVIWDINRSKCGSWPAIVKGCYDLIEIAEARKAQHSGYFYSFTRIYDICLSELLEKIKPIVCTKGNRESMERFELFKILSDEYPSW